MEQVYNGKLLIHSKNEIVPFAATWMDLDSIILSEVSQKEKDKYHDIAYMWNLKKDTSELFTNQKEATDIVQTAFNCRFQ